MDHKLQMQFGLLVFVLLHSSMTASAGDREIFISKEVVHARRLIQQDPQAAPTAVFNPCNYGGETAEWTNKCSPSCYTCKNTPGDPSKRQCGCCMPGYRLDDKTKKCQPCRAGTHAPEVGATRCENCEISRSTTNRSVIYQTCQTTLVPGSRYCNGECKLAMRWCSHHLNKVVRCNMMI